MTKLVDNATGPALKKAPDKRITKARSVLITSQPFFGTLALYLELIEDESIGTMATDGKSLIYAPSFLDKIDDKETQGVIAHEVLHCAYRHHTRRGDRNPDLWNKAADYAINRDLLAGGFKLPSDRLYDKRFGQMGAEEIYRVLADEQKKNQGSKGQQSQQQPQAGQGKPQQGQQSQQGQQQPQKGQSGQQSGKGKSDAGQASGQPQPGQGSGNGQRQPVPWGTVLDAAPEHAPAQKAQADQEWETRVQQAINVAKAHHAGSVPGNLQALVKEVKKARVDWREETRRFVDAKTRFDYAWTRPNRRLAGHGIFLPGIVADGVNKIGVGRDTSGSIFSVMDLFAKFMGEMQAASDEAAIDELIIVDCDTEVRQVERFRQGDDITKSMPRGGGGTRFSPVFDWFQKNEPEVSAIIYFTDLECSDFGDDPGVPVLWIAYGDPRKIARYREDVPFGEVIEISAD